MKKTNAIMPAVVEVLLNDAIAPEVFLHLASRRNNASETLTKTYQNLLKNRNVKRSEITKCWKKLEEAGCGRFIEGKWGRESRFAWNFPTREFCKSAILTL